MGRFLWRIHVHPAQVLVRQAADSNWVASRTILGEDGVRNTCVVRDGFEAMISFTNGNVVLIDPPRDEPFADFLHLERWLAQGAADDPEVRSALAAYHEIRDELVTFGAYHGVAVDEIEPWVLKALRDSKLTVASIRDDGLTPRTLVFLLIGNALKEALPYGNYYIYRGTLNGTGEALREIWSTTIRELENSRFLSEEQAEAGREWMRQAIAEAG